MDFLKGEHRSTKEQIAAILWDLKLNGPINDKSGFSASALAARINSHGYNFKLSGQRMSLLIKSLVEDYKVLRRDIKGKRTFSIELAAPESFEMPSNPFARASEVQPGEQATETSADDSSAINVTTIEGADVQLLFDVAKVVAQNVFSRLESLEKDVADIKSDDRRAFVPGDFTASEEAPAEPADVIEDREEFLGPDQAIRESSPSIEKAPETGYSEDNEATGPTSESITPPPLYNATEPTPPWVVNPPHEAMSSSQDTPAQPPQQSDWDWDDSEQAKVASQDARTETLADDEGWTPYSPEPPENATLEFSEGPREPEKPEIHRFVPDATEGPIEY